MESGFYAGQGTLVSSSFLNPPIEALQPVRTVDIPPNTHIVLEVGEVILYPLTISYFREKGIMFTPATGKGSEAHQTV